MELTGLRVDATRLPITTRRYLANHLLDQIKRHRWRKHRTALTPAPRFTVFGGPSYTRPAPTTELLNKYISTLTLPEPRLGIPEMYALLLAWDAYQRFFVVDMDREGLWYGWVSLLAGDARKAWHLKQPDAEHPEPRLTRNARMHVSEEGALACERLLYYADVVRLSPQTQSEYLEALEERRARRLPDDAVRVIEVALKAA